MSCEYLQENLWLALFMSSCQQVLMALLWLENKAWATNCSHAKIAARPEIKFCRIPEWEPCPKMLILTYRMCCAVSLLVHCVLHPFLLRL